MSPRDSSIERPFATPSQALLAGALAGLLGLGGALGGCSEESSEAPVTQAPGGAAGSETAGSGGEAGQGEGGEESYSRVISETPISYEEFLIKCDEWGGFVQTTAVCAGNNACKGVLLSGTDAHRALVPRDERVRTRDELRALSSGLR